MRLSTSQTRLTLDCVRQQFGADAQVMLFGSQLDDTARGGDVDLLVETAAHPSVRQRALATMALEQALNLPVDIVAHQCGTPASAFERMVSANAQLLELPAVDDIGTAGRPRQRRPTPGLAGTIFRDDLIEPAVATDEWEALNRTHSRSCAHG